MTMPRSQHPDSPFCRYLGHNVVKEWREGRRRRADNATFAIDEDGVDAEGFGVRVLPDGKTLMEHCQLAQE